jgi:hypothetical protein
VGVGETLRLRFGVAPTQVVLLVPGSGTELPLRAGRTTTWRVTHLGILIVTIRARQGSASYVAMLTP